MWRAHLCPFWLASWYLGLDGISQIFIFKKVTDSHDFELQTYQKIRKSSGFELVPYQKAREFLSVYDLVIFRWIREIFKLGFVIALVASVDLRFLCCPVDTVDGHQKSGIHSPVEVGSEHSIISKVLYIPGDCWDFFHRQYQNQNKGEGWFDWRCFSPNSFTVAVLNAVLSVSALAAMLCPPP